MTSSESSAGLVRNSRALIGLGTNGTPEHMSARQQHVVFIKYGDYREAAERFEAGGTETYAAQRYSVEFVASLAKDRQVTVISLPPGPYRVTLSSGVTAIGMGWERKRDVPALLQTLEGLRPTHLVVGTPLIPALLWGLLRAERVLPHFSDSFSDMSWRARITKRVLVQILNRRTIEVVANHNRPASCELVGIGVDPNKVVPWDWPSHMTPSGYPEKEAPDSTKVFSLFYVGLVSQDKGVGDLIEALALLRFRGLNMRATIAGTGAIDAMQQLATERGVASYVDFLGRVGNDQVLQLMRDHDAVVVPSRRTCPEGMPMTIYEGLCSRTPLVISSHPMFEQTLRAQPGLKMFDEGNPQALADALAMVATNPEVYRQISAESATTWNSIQVPLKFGELLSRWISGTADDIAALRGYAIGQMERSGQNEQIHPAGSNL